MRSPRFARNWLAKATPSLQMTAMNPLRSVSYRPEQRGRARPSEGALLNFAAMHVDPFIKVVEHILVEAVQIPELIMDIRPQNP